MPSILSMLSDRPDLLVGPAATLLGTTVAALIALRVSAAVNLRNKRIDIISRCNERYDALAQTKTDIIKNIARANSPDSDMNDSKKDARLTISYEIELFHRRFWGLKSDQIDYWLAGYVDPETLISWFMSTADAIHNPVELWCDIEETENGGWNSVKSFHETTNPRLFQVVEFLQEERFARLNQNNRYALLFDIFRSIESEEDPLIGMLTRNNHRRLSMSRFKAKLPVKIARYVLARELRELRANLRRARIAEKCLPCENVEQLFDAEI